jgi:hypothetical protein
VRSRLTSSAFGRLRDAEGTFRFTNGPLTQLAERPFMRSRHPVIDLSTWDETMRARWAPLRDRAGYAALRGDERMGQHDDVPLEIGSAFTVFVAAEYARQVGAGRLDPAALLTVQAADRVDSSIIVDAIPDGGGIVLSEAAEAMIGASDNTATDLVLRAVGPDQVRVLLAELGVDATIPDSTKSLYERWRAQRSEPVRASITTMRDLAGFYRSTVSERSLGEEATDVFLALMREEDILQGAEWPNGVVAHRKSGMVEPPPLLAMSMGGAFVHAGGAVTAFAFALNVPFPEDAAYEDSPLDPTVLAFSEGLRRGLDALAEG